MVIKQFVKLYWGTQISFSTKWVLNSYTISMLDHKKFGLIVHNEKKRGVLLPDLEGIQSVYEQLELALKKAGIEEHEEYQMERFLVERHSS